MGHGQLSSAPQALAFPFPSLPSPSFPFLPLPSLPFLSLPFCGEHKLKISHTELCSLWNAPAYPVSGLRDGQ